MQILSEIKTLLINELSDEHMVLIGEKKGQRGISMIIGFAEAVAIYRTMRNEVPPRPMTHNLINNTIEKLGGALERLVISDIRDHVFIGTLVVKNSKGRLKIDCRPSDGMALATLAGAPIFVKERVFDKVGVILEP
jgi:bifunctional DNase/RNase